MATGYEGLETSISNGLGHVGSSLDKVATAIRHNSFYTAVVAKQLNVLNENYFKLESEKLSQLKEHMKALESSITSLEELYKINLFMDIIEKYKNGFITLSDEQQKYINTYISDYLQRSIDYCKNLEHKKKNYNGYKVRILGNASDVNVSKDTLELKREVSQLCNK